MNYKNKIAKIIFFSAYTYMVLLFVVGLLFAIQYRSFNVAITIWIGGFMSSLFFYGFAEIIELLYQLNNKAVKGEAIVNIEESVNKE